MPPGTTPLVTMQAATARQDLNVPEKAIGGIFGLSGEAIIRTIDFKMNLQRDLGPKGDRVSTTMSGSFLPYTTY
jgi:cyanate lyase